MWAVQLGRRILTLFNFNEFNLKFSSFTWLVAPISGQCRWSCTPTRPQCLSDTRRKSWKPQSGCTHPAKDGQGAEGPTSQGGKPCEEPQKQWRKLPHLNSCWGQSFLSLAQQLSLVVCLLAQRAVTTLGRLHKLTSMCSPFTRLQ